MIEEIPPILLGTGRYRYLVDGCIFAENPTQATQIEGMLSRMTPPMQAMLRFNASRGTLILCDSEVNERSSDQIFVNRSSDAVGFLRGSEVTRPGGTPIQFSGEAVELTTCSSYRAPLSEYIFGRFQQNASYRAPPSEFVFGCFQQGEFSRSQALNESMLALEETALSAGADKLPDIFTKAGQFAVKRLPRVAGMAANKLIRPGLFKLPNSYGLVAATAVEAWMLSRRGEQLTAGTMSKALVNGVVGYGVDFAVVKLAGGPAGWGMAIGSVIEPIGSHVIDRIRFEEVEVGFALKLQPSSQLPNVTGLDFSRVDLFKDSYRAAHNVLPNNEAACELDTLFAFLRGLNDAKSFLSNRMWSNLPSIDEDVQGFRVRHEKTNQIMKDEGSIPDFSRWPALRKSIQGAEEVSRELDTFMKRRSEIMSELAIEPRDAEAKFPEVTVEAKSSAPTVPEVEIKQEAQNAEGCASREAALLANAVETIKELSNRPSPEAPVGVKFSREGIKWDGNRIFVSASSGSIEFNFSSSTLCPKFGDVGFGLCFSERDVSDFVNRSQFSGHYIDSDKITLYGNKYVINIRSTDSWSPWEVSIQVNCKELGVNRQEEIITLKRFNLSDKKNLPLIQEALNKAMQPFIVKRMGQAVASLNSGVNQALRDNNFASARSIVATCRRDLSDFSTPEMVDGLERLSDFVDFSEKKYRVENADENFLSNIISDPEYEEFVLVAKERLDQLTLAESMSLVESGDFDSALECTDKMYDSELKVKVSEALRAGGEGLLQLQREDKVGRLKEELQLIESQYWAADVSSSERFAEAMRTYSTDALLCLDEDINQKKLALEEWQTVQEELGGLSESLEEHGFSEALQYEKIEWLERQQLVAGYEINRFINESAYLASMAFFKIGRLAFKIDKLGKKSRVKKVVGAVEAVNDNAWQLILQYNNYCIQGASSAAGSSGLSVIFALIHSALVGSRLVSTLSGGGRTNSPSAYIEPVGQVFLPTLNLLTASANNLYGLQTLRPEVLLNIPAVAGTYLTPNPYLPGARNKLFWGAVGRTLLEDKFSLAQQVGVVSQFGSTISAWIERLCSQPIAMVGVSTIKSAPTVSFLLRGCQLYFAYTSSCKNEGRRWKNYLGAHVAREFNRALADCKSNDLKRKKEGALEIKGVVGFVRNNFPLEKLPEDIFRIYLTSFYYSALFEKRLECMSTAPDGSCLFSALSYYINKTPSELRGIAVEYIRQNKHDVTLEQLIEGDIDDHIEKMSKNGTFGTTAEIYALSKIYKRPILVLINGALGFDLQNIDLSNFPASEPIFIDLENNQYRPVLVRGELYVEESYQYKLNSIIEELDAESTVTEEPLEKDVAEEQAEEGGVEEPEEKASATEVLALMKKNKTSLSEISERRKTCSDLITGINAKLAGLGVFTDSQPRQEFARPCPAATVKT